MDNNVTRRSFLNVIKQFLAATGITAIFAPVVAYFYPSNLEEIPSDPVKVCAEADLPLNESIVVKFGRYPAIVVNTPEGLRAYSAICTHFACLVKWDKDTGLIVCPCHDAAFDPSDGNNLTLPAPSPLTAFNVEVIDGDIYISGGDA